MNCIFKGASVFYKGSFEKKDIAVKGGKFIDLSEALGFDEIDLCGKYIFPGFIDVHTHMREPGFEYKENLKSGTMAAALGGYTHILAMPNLNPVPDNEENIRLQLERISENAVINVYPYGAITKGEMGKELSDMEALSKYCIAFSDDGKGVESRDMMKRAMQKAAELDMIIAAHCEDNSLLCGGYINKGEYAMLHGHLGISSESEWKQIERDIALVRETGCKYHVCHVSTAKSVEIIRDAKLEGLSVTCETAPHYLTLCDDDLREDGRFKMNPPLRSREDMKALLEGAKDGTIDMIATDHAPHSQEEKSKGLKNSLMGITGLETAFPILYTKLVRENIITLERLLEMMHTLPHMRFGIGNDIEPGKRANFTVYNLDREYIINSEEFLSKGKSTPFEGERVCAECEMTVCEGVTVWKRKEKN